MSEVIGSVQVVVAPDTTGFAKKARKDIEDQFSRKNALELDFEVDPESVRRDVEDARDLAQQWLDLKKNTLKVNVGIQWRKTDILRQLRDFKTDVESLEKLARPTVYANFEVDKKGLDTIREDVKLNVGIDEKTLQRTIEKATEGITPFGDEKTVRERAKTVAELTRNTISDILQKRKLTFQVEADGKKVKHLGEELDRALGRVSVHAESLARVEDKLNATSASIKKQTALVANLNEEWLELEESGELNGRQLSYYANTLREAEESLHKMVVEEKALRNYRNYAVDNQMAPSAIHAERLRKELEALKQTLEDTDMEIGLIADRTSFTAVASEIAWIARDRIATVWAVVRTSGLGDLERHWRAISQFAKTGSYNAAKWIGQLTGVRVLWHTFKDMVEILPKLDMMVPQLAQNLALITTAAAGAVGGLGLLVTLISDLGQMGKLVLALPTLLLGLTGSVLIVGRAIKDFKEVFPEIIAYYKELGTVVSDRVWKRAAGPIRELHKATKPLLDAKIPQWADAWGDSMASLAKGIGSATGIARLEMFLDNSILGTKKATKGWESLGNALMRMIGAGSNVLPDLGTWFSDTMGEFDKWTAKNEHKFEPWIREGATALRELGSIGVSTVKIFAGLGAAFSAAGWPGLTELERVMRSIGESALMLKDDESMMQPLIQIRDFFAEFGTIEESASRAWRNFWFMLGDTAETMSGPIVGAIGAILDGFNSEKFQTGFGDFVSGLGSFIEDITPGIEALTADIGSLLGVVGTAGESWGPAFNDMLLMFSSAGDKLHPGLTEFIENTGPALQDLVRDITPHVEDFATAISDLLGNEGFQEFIGDMIGTFGDLAGTALDLGTAIAGLLEDFSDWYASLDPGSQKVVRWGLILGGVFAGVGLAAGRMALSVAPGAVLGAIGVAFRKVFKPGGLMKIVRPIIGRFAGVLAGPAGWLIVFASVIKPLDVAATAEHITDALGLGDSFLGKFTTSLRENIESSFGDKSLLTIILDNFRESFTKFSEGDILGGIVELIKGLFHPLNFVKVVADAVLEALGFGGEAEIAEANGYYAKAWEEGGIGGVFDAFWEAITGSLNKQWDLFTGLFTEYEIPHPFEFLSWLWGVIKEAFGLGKGSTTWPTTSSISPTIQSDMNFSSAFSSDVTTGLDGGWESLLALIKSWAPSSIFNLLSWIGSKLGDWLSGMAEGAADVGKGLVSGVGGVLDWGADKWASDVKPWLDSGWETLKSRIGGWAPGGDAGLGSAIDRALGTSPTSTARTTENFKAIGETLGAFATDSLSRLGTLGNGGRREIEGLADTTDAEFGRMSLSGSTNTSSMSAGVVGNMLGMKLGGVAAALGLKTGATGQMSSMSSDATSKADGMKSKVVGRMLAMQVQGVAKAAAMQASVVSKMSTMQSQATAKAAVMQASVAARMSAMSSRSTAQAQSMQVSVVAKAAAMQAQFVAQMARMSSLALGVAHRLRGSLTSALTINASGAGRHTGSTYVSGLSGGLSRAVSVAYSMAGSVRRALSFNVSSSGSAVGGSFASGLRSRVGAVASAANALARAARAPLPNSPADVGPFSGAGWGGWGESIADELARGLKMGAPTVAREASLMMAAAAEELNGTARIGFAPDVRAIGSALSASSPAGNAIAAGATINVNVESRSEDPLQDGNRFGGDIAFALRGAGLA